MKAGIFFCVFKNSTHPRVFLSINTKMMNGIVVFENLRVVVFLPITPRSRSTLVPIIPPSRFSRAREFPNPQRRFISYPVSIKDLLIRQ